MTPTRPEPTPLSPAILHGATRPDLLRDETLPADELQRATYLTDLTESLP